MAYEYSLNDDTRSRNASREPAVRIPSQWTIWIEVVTSEIPKQRFFDEDDISFEALCESHWRSTRERAAGTWLLIGDTTQIEFGIFREVSGLGPTGDGGGRGFFLHSELTVAADTEEIVGLAGGERKG